MQKIRAASQILDDEFLTLRAKALEIAAGLDRLDRATGDVSSDPRRQKLAEALQTLLSPDEGRAERIQLLFSRRYEANWQTNK